METFEVKRGLVKKLAAEGGLAGVAGKHFDNVDGSGDSFSGSHGIMTSIAGEYNALGKLVVDCSRKLFLKKKIFKQKRVKKLIY